MYETTEEGGVGSGQEFESGINLTHPSELVGCKTLTFRGLV